MGRMDENVLGMGSRMAQVRSRMQNTLGRASVPPSQIIKKNYRGWEGGTTPFQVGHTVFSNNAYRRCDEDRSSRRRTLAAFADDPEKIAKFIWQLIPPEERIETEDNRVQKAMANFPIIGLFVQLTNAEGGLDGEALRFSEFARRILDNVSPKFYDSVEALRGLRGTEISFSTCVYSLWTSAYGAGLVFALIETIKPSVLFPD